MTPLTGYAVQITRKDGTTYLMRPTEGNVTPIWHGLEDPERDSAILRNNGLSASVVRVRYTVTEVVP